MKRSRERRSRGERLYEVYKEDEEEEEGKDTKGGIRSCSCSAALCLLGAL